LTWLLGWAGRKEKQEASGSARPPVASQSTCMHMYLLRTY